MNLVQKLSVGLSFGCLMFMSSCSKENVQIPEPKVESSNDHSNLKTDALPWISPTKAYAGINALPNFWERRALESGDPAKYPFGTSTFPKLWGNESLKWQGSFPALSNQPWNTFITTTTATTSKTEKTKMTKVGTLVRFLKPYRTYILEFYLASARPHLDASGQVPTLIEKCLIGMKSPNTGQVAENQSFEVNMLSYPVNKWVKKTIQFTATNEEMWFEFGATSLQQGKTAYAHLFIGQNAISEKK